MSPRAVGSAGYGRGVLVDLVVLLVFPDGERNSGDATGQSQAGQMRLGARRQQPLIVAMERVVGQLLHHGQGRALEDALEHRVAVAVEATDLDVAAPAPAA